MGLASVLHTPVSCCMRIERSQHFCLRILHFRIKRLWVCGLAALQLLRTQVKPSAIHAATILGLKLLGLHAPVSSAGKQERDKLQLQISLELQGKQLESLCVLAKNVIPNYRRNLRHGCATQSSHASPCCRALKLDSCTRLCSGL